MFVIERAFGEFGEAAALAPCSKTKPDSMVSSDTSKNDVAVRHGDVIASPSTR